LLVTVAAGLPSRVGSGRLRLPTFFFKGRLR